MSVREENEREKEAELIEKEESEEREIEQKKEREKERGVNFQLSVSPIQRNPFIFDIDSQQERDSFFFNKIDRYKDRKINKPTYLDLYVL